GPWALRYYSVLFGEPDGRRLGGSHVPGKGLIAWTSPHTFAKESQSAAVCHSYSMARATFSLTSRPWVRAITCSAMSMPAETPEEVTNFPSSTHRAALTQVTRGPWPATHWKKALLVVARRPSR